MATKNTIDDNGLLYVYQKIKGEMPSKMSELTNDSNYVQDANYVHTEENFSTELKGKLNGVEAGAEANVQANWTQSDSSKDDYIKNKPTLGTAAAKDSTNAVTANSTDLVESGAVKSAIDAAVASAYKPGGSKTCTELLPALLVESNKGFVYNMSDSGTTTEYFVEGAGEPILAGQDVAIVDSGSGVYKFNIMAGIIDLSGYMKTTDIHWMTNAEIEELLNPSNP